MSSRTVTTTPATTRSGPRSKTSRTPRDSSSGSESGEEDELRNGIDVFQREATEEQLQDTALVDERASGTSQAAVVLETDDEPERSADGEEAAGGEDLVDTE
jgi:hypothetical protein